MNKYLVLTETIIKSMVSDPETVSAKEFLNEDENDIQIEVLVSKEDIPRIIGKDGKVVAAIRTIVQASSSLSDGKKIKINIDSY